MKPILPLFLLPFQLGVADPALEHRGEIHVSIIRDPYTSSDQVTLCRVRAVNDGSRRWAGKTLRFEARGIQGAEVVRERGRFGLVLEPHGTLETLIALPGRHDRLEVELLPAGPSRNDAEQKSRKRGPGHKSRKRPR